MRTYEKIQKMVECESLAELSCDICGKTTNRGDWEEATWDVNEVEIGITVRHKNGTAFPEGGSGEEYLIDICPECFVKKLVPYVESFGRKITPKEWYF